MEKKGEKVTNKDKLFAYAMKDVTRATAHRAKCGGSFKLTEGS